MGGRRAVTVTCASSFNVCNSEVFDRFVAAVVVEYRAGACTHADGIGFQEVLPGGYLRDFEAAVFTGEGAFYKCGVLGFVKGYSSKFDGLSVGLLH